MGAIRGKPSVCIYCTYILHFVYARGYAVHLPYRIYIYIYMIAGWRIYFWEAWYPVTPLQFLPPRTIHKSGALLFCVLKYSGKRRGGRGWRLKEWSRSRGRHAVVLLSSCLVPLPFLSRKALFGGRGLEDKRNQLVCMLASSRGCCDLRLAPGDGGSSGAARPEEGSESLQLLFACPGPLSLSVFCLPPSPLIAVHVMI